MHRILIVDDDPNVSLLMRLTLSRDGDFDLQVASNGEDALQMADQFHPDLMLLDLMMPGIDGMEVCRRIKADDNLRNISVIMVTAKREPGDIIKGMNLGADDYITKPFNPEELLARVRVHLRIRMLEQKTAAHRELEAVLKMALTMQHEINNPLTGIMGNSELLSDWPNLPPEEVNKCVEVINQSAKRIRDIVQRMSSVTKVVSAPYLAGKEMIDIHKSSEENVEG
ncbi:MAG: response regulator [Nitrospinota bacterium]|nr:response regulator [Nitrospinota bacterium]MDH5677923.1 response regulator [Nitrospinota bacterium]MDH5755752.1 response regulator [Nitrospinota bacterium]